MGDHYYTGGSIPLRKNTSPAAILRIIDGLKEAISDVEHVKIGTEEFIEFNGEYSNDTFERAINEYKGFFKNSDWWLVEGAYLCCERIHNRRLQICEVAPDGNWSDYFPNG